jgi:predicted ATPase
MSFATQHGLPFWLGLATFELGWTLARQGRYEDGIAQMRQGVAIYQATGARLGLAQGFTALAEAHGKVGQHKEGFTALAEADAHIETSGECFCAAEAARVKGVLLLQQAADTPLAKRPGRKAKSDTSAKRLPPHSSAATEAEACFLQALTITQQQQAKSLELRAAMNLAQLWRQQGKTREAHNLLADIYGWFTEGFDTADLQEARALLEELA